MTPSIHATLGILFLVAGRQFSSEVGQSRAEVTSETIVKFYLKYISSTQRLKLKVRVRQGRTKNDFVCNKMKIVYFPVNLSSLPPLVLEV